MSMTQAKGRRFEAGHQHLAAAQFTCFCGSLECVFAVCWVLGSKLALQYSNRFSHRAHATYTLYLSTPLSVFLIATRQDHDC